MAVVVDFIYLIIWTAGVVHQHHIILVQVLALADAVSLEELLRRVGFILPGKLCGRYAVSHYEHSVNGTQLFHLQDLQLLLAHASLAFFAQGDAELAELSFQMAAELAGAVADICFGHYVGRDNTVLCSQISNTRISAAVGERMLEEPAYHLAVDGLFACIYDTLQEQVALL